MFVILFFLNLCLAQEGIWKSICTQSSDCTKYLVCTEGRCTPPNPPTAEQCSTLSFAHKDFRGSIREERSFTTDFRIKAWLYRVTSNLCFNLVRNKKRRSAILDAAKMSDRSDADQLLDIFSDERRIEVLKGSDDESVISSPSSCEAICFERAESISASWLSST